MVCRIFLFFLFFMMTILLPIVSHAWEAVVLAIVDGDTLTVAPLGSKNPDQIAMAVRLYGIDAPEMNTPDGKLSKKNLENLLAPGQMVQIITVESDRYDRIVALVQLEGINLNLEQVRQGQAKVDKKYCQARFCRNWKKEEEKAKNSRQGLWAEWED